MDGWAPRKPRRQKGSRRTTWKAKHLESSQKHHLIPVRPQHGRVRQGSVSHLFGSMVPHYGCSILALLQVLPICTGRKRRHPAAQLSLTLNSSKFRSLSSGIKCQAALFSLETFLLAHRQEHTLWSDTDPGQKHFFHDSSIKQFQFPLTLLMPQFSNAWTISIYQGLLKQYTSQPSSQDAAPSHSQTQTCSLSQSCLTQSCSAATETVLEQKLPLPRTISSMQICLKTSVSCHLPTSISPLGSQTAAVMQKSLTIDRRALRWPPTLRGLLRLPGPQAPSGPGLWRQRSGTAVRGTGLAGGTTMTCSFPQGKITSVGNDKETKSCIPKSPKAGWKYRCRRALEDNTTEESSGNYLLCCSSQRPWLSPHTLAAECVPHSQVQLLTSCCLTLLGLLWCSELEEFISLAWDCLIQAKERG